MGSFLYIIYLLATGGMAAYGYFDNHTVVMWIGIVLFVIGLLPIVGDDAIDLFD